MGTNYYLIEKACPTCGRGEKLHIGKSSGGWCFGLHVYPDDPNLPQNLEDWKKKFQEPGSVIQDEYKRVLTYDNMLEQITDRSWPYNKKSERSEKWYHENDAQPGPNGLTRYKIDGAHCIGHGEGTWDFLVGYFS